MIFHLRKILPKVNKDGDLSDWTKFARDPALWKKITKNVNIEAEIPENWAESNNDNSSSPKSQNSQNNAQNNPNRNDTNKSPPTHNQSRSYQSENDPHTSTGNEYEYDTPQRSPNSQNTPSSSSNMDTPIPFEEKVMSPITHHSKESALTRLGLPMNATRKEIVMQYRKLARYFHPDKWNNQKRYSLKTCETQFKDIANAYAKAKSLIRG